MLRIPHEDRLKNLVMLLHDVANRVSGSNLVVDCTESQSPTKQASMHVAATSHRTADMRTGKKQKKRKAKNKKKGGEGRRSVPHISVDAPDERTWHSAECAFESTSPDEDEPGSLKTCWWRGWPAYTHAIISNSHSEPNVGCPSQEARWHKKVGKLGTTGSFTGRAVDRTHQVRKSPEEFAFSQLHLSCIPW